MIIRRSQYKLKYNLFLTTAILLLFCQDALASAETLNLPVTAKVNVSCQFESDNLALNFGNYDALGSNATQPADTQVTIQTRCTRKARYYLSIDNGQYYQQGKNHMKNMRASSYLAYELYKDPNRAVVITAPLQEKSRGNNKPTKTTIYARIPPGQNVFAGDYSDILLVTLSY